MKDTFTQAAIAGVERLTAWADLLDTINVYPVADGDTGRNLAISLTPMRYFDNDPDKTIHRLLLSARGNSGNIASSFFSGFLKANSISKLLAAAKDGRNQAYKAVQEPKQGTMLSVFDALVEILDNTILNKDGWHLNVIEALEKAVKSTPEFLTELKEAGVVDSGALGIYIYLETYFTILAGNDKKFRSIHDIFKGSLQISSSFNRKVEEGYCIDMVLRVDGQTEELVQSLNDLGEETVIIEDDTYLKVHLHTDKKQNLRDTIGPMADILKWSDDDLSKQTKDFLKNRSIKNSVHIVSDAAGSLCRNDSQQLGFTLLNSYITVGNTSLPETHFVPEDLYSAMKTGKKVSTSQASTFERHQYYQSLLEMNETVIYISVGSFFTGNYDIAVKWKEENDPDGRFIVIDSTTASGRLGTLVLAAARFARDNDDPEKITAFVNKTIQECEEYLFLDKLNYLAAGGRLSKTSAFFGDMLKMKPVISPMSDGARKVAVVRNQDDQIKFAIERLQTSLKPGTSPFIMLEYTDNMQWVIDTVRSRIEELYPSAEIFLQPLSLTTGAHTGPGTWGVAFLPESISGSY